MEPGGLHTSGCTKALCCCRCKSWLRINSCSIVSQAVFNTTITSATRLPTLFNTGELSSEPAPGTATEPDRTTHHFAPTPPMATYLFGAMVGELESVEGVYTRGQGSTCGRSGASSVGAVGEPVAVRVWGRVGQSASLTLARDASIAAIGCAPQSRT